MTSRTVTMTMQVTADQLKRYAPQALARITDYLNRLTAIGMLTKTRQDTYQASYCMTAQTTKKNKAKIIITPANTIINTPDYLFTVDLTTVPTQNILCLRETKTNGKYQLYPADDNVFRRLLRPKPSRFVLVEAATPQQEYTYDLQATPHDAIIAQALQELRRAA